MGAVIIVQIYTLFRYDGFEWACVQIGRMQFSGCGCNTYSKIANALNEIPVQTAKALAQQRHGQIYACHKMHESKSDRTEQANDRKT